MAPSKSKNKDGKQKSNTNGPTKTTANTLKKATPRTVKKKIGVKTTGMENEITMATSPVKMHRERDSRIENSPNDRPKTKPKTTDKEMETTEPTSVITTPIEDNETLVQVQTPTSKAFDETFKKLSKHEQIKGFTNYKEAKNRLNSAIHSLNAIKGYTTDSIESHMASIDPSTWKDIFAKVY
jgi:hypothetical protein